MAWFEDVSVGWVVFYRFASFCFVGIKLSELYSYFRIYLEGFSRQLKATLAGIFCWFRGTLKVAELLLGSNPRRFSYRLFYFFENPWKSERVTLGFSSVKF